MNIKHYQNNTDIYCWNCKKIIHNNSIIYMCVDNPFCSTYCRDKQFVLIKNMDPELNFPDKWYKNDNTTKVNCFIEIDYFRPSSYKNNNYMKKISRTQSLCDLNIKREKMIITCIKFHIFDIKISNKTLKKCIALLSIIMISILIKSKY